MRILGLEVRRAPATAVPTMPGRGGWWPLVREPFTGAWQRNQEWTTDTVLAHHAVYSCVTRIAQDMGKLRPKLVELDQETGIWTEVTNTAHSPVLLQPNHFQNYIQFKAWWATSLQLHGNVYVLKRRDGRGVVDALYLLDPTKVRVLVAPDGEVFYEIRQDFLSGVRQETVAVPASEVVHDRINCLFHPLVGTSPIFASGTAANMGLRIEQNSSEFFGNGSNPSGILSTVTSIGKQKALELQEIWNAQYGGVNSGRVAVLGDGMKFEPMRMTAVDSQLLEQLRWSAETVCSAFHVPAWKVGIGAAPAYTKPETANLAYYSDCLQSPIEQWEVSMDEALELTDSVAGPGGRTRRLGVELDLDGLIRMDLGSQVTTLKEAVSGSLLTVNDARKRLSEKPVAGGDAIWMQQQNYSLEALAERDRNDPFAKPEPAPPPLPPKPEDEEEEDEPDEARSTEVVLSAWGTWFFRDTLDLLRTATTSRGDIVRAALAQADADAARDEILRGFATDCASSRESSGRLLEAVTALASREAAAPVVHVAPPAVNVTIEAPEQIAESLVTAMAEQTRAVVQLAARDQSPVPETVARTLDAIRELASRETPAPQVTVNLPRPGVKTIELVNARGEKSTATVTED